MRKIIDAHHLVGEDYWLSKNKTELAFRNNIDKILEEKINALIYPFPSSQNQLYINENSIINEYAIKNKNIVPVFALNTNYKESYARIEKYANNFKCFGIVIWPILCNIDLTTLKDNMDFVEFCKKYNFFIYVHVGAGNEKDIKRVEKLGDYTPVDALQFAKNFYWKKIILGHMLRLSFQSLTEAKKQNNVLIETSGISSQKRWFENGQNVFPSYDAKIFKNMDSKEILEYCINEMKLEDKLTFGSSYPYSLWWNYDLKDEIELINKLEVSKKIKDKILYDNVSKFLNLNNQ